MDILAYGVKDDKSPLKPINIVRRALRANDVEVEIMYCGVCHSDYHHIKNDWNDSRYPMVPGHEIIGRIINIGNSARSFEIGDIVAIGNMTDSC